MKYLCPDCGGQMEYKGYRMLFLNCTECGETHHVDDCSRQD